MTETTETTETAAEEEAEPEAARVRVAHKVIHWGGGQTQFYRTSLSDACRSAERDGLMLFSIVDAGEYHVAVFVGAEEFVHGHAGEQEAWSEEGDQ